MERINHDAAKAIVRKALKEVADFSGDIEEFTFNQFQPFHTKVFLTSVKNLVNKTECSDRHGNITNKEYFDIDLSEGLQKNWENMGDCIDYVAGKHIRGASPTDKIHLP